MDSQLIIEIVVLIAVYLFGSIPFSVILGTKIKGIDVRKHGSGNPGGTNSLRFLGKPVGISIIILDAFKGGLVLLILLAGWWHVEYLPPLLFGVVGATGHVFSIFMKFKGGKAVAATVGLIVGYNIIWALIAVVVFFTVMKISKYVSIGSTSVPITILILSIIWRVGGLPQFHELGTHSYFWYELVFVLYILVLIVFRHRSNYNNIKNGVEPKAKWTIKKADR
jgi:glycerol-3-phosphate acyltransferase PlsY